VTTNNPRQRLSRQHELDVATLLDGDQSKASGNQWHDAADGKHDRYEEFAFAWDCKCVLPTTKSMSVSREDLAKLIEQSRGRRPAMPIRFYDSERGHVAFDFIIIQLTDFAELRERAMS
jgi:hypothetical protein